GYGLQLLPLNYAGLGLIIFGMVLMVAEAFIPSFGILGIGGIASFVIGSVILIDTEVDVFQVSLPIVAAIATFAALLLGFTLRMFMKIRHGALVSGIQTFVGTQGVCMEGFDKSGMVKVQGELWQAEADQPLHQGDKVEVLSVDGLHLKVKKV
ncbi:MAG: NfeD family protein, partial [Pseudohongiellaceae bacterium]